VTADLALPPPAADDAAPPGPLYDSVQEWVNEHFLPMYRRPIGGEYRWCSQWWRHAEAITRLTALWQSWEAMRLQPGTGTANWLLTHLDHQLPVLLGRSGPFAQCSPGEHVEPRPATAEPPPPGWWDDDAEDVDDDGAWPVALAEPSPSAWPDPGTTDTEHGAQPEDGREST
jgi:Domain of unknown function (DUF4913)